MISMTWPVARPSGGIVDDIEREDDARGFEPEDVLRFPGRISDLDLELFLAPVGGDGQCSNCGQWYPDWNGGVCTGCQTRK
jgi:hypothetical protein